jgi:cephalosporin-C deacetylase-like acetyl esterase
MLERDIARRLREANRASSRQWHESASENRESWEAFRREKIDRLRCSLGEFPPRGGRVEVHVSGTIEGDGFVVENLVVRGRPGLWITASFYRPAKPPNSMPGLVICHSHHTPKSHRELQDMGMTWARAGACVLILDQIGHGEGREHPFHTAGDYSGEFRVSRQDYYHRYDTSVQLDLAGQSLIGQMAWDISRCVDVLLAREGVDPERIAILGSVAGGGDPAAVAAALDERISAAVVFNFGGPQPETRYPLPDDAEESFHYAGGGSWESTRNLRRSAADGFLPWVIVGSIAPRNFVYAHEFSWDRERDPVWKRLTTLYAMYDAPQNLAFTHGHGLLSGQPPDASHCTHIGREHRARIHEALNSWFDLSVSEETEYSSPLPAERLRCMTADLDTPIIRVPLHKQLQLECAARLEEERSRSATLEPAECRKEVQAEWRRLLGPVDPPEKVAAHIMDDGERADTSEVRVSRITLDVEPGVVVPLVLLHRVGHARRDEADPVVVMVSHRGNADLLAHRSDEIARLLTAGVAVCLPDVRGTGATRPDTENSLDRTSASTSLASSELMLGGTLLGARLRDLRAVLAWLRLRKELDPKRIAVWGVSLAPVNNADTDFRVPRGAGERPAQCEPLGGLLALLAALYEDDLAAVCVDRGLADYLSVLDHWSIYLPYDAHVPGALTRGDLPDVAAALAPMPLALREMVDGLNRPIDAQQLAEKYRPAIETYRRAAATDRLSLEAAPPADPTRWLLDHLRP